MLGQVEAWVGAVAILGLASWLGGLPLFALTFPAVAGAIVALTRLDPVVAGLTRFDAWIDRTRPAMAGAEGKLSRYVIRPWLWGVGKIRHWSARIGDRYRRSGVQLASYLYFSSAVALAVYFALIVTVVLVLMAIGLMIALWALGHAMGSGSSGDVVDKVVRRRAGKVYVEQEDRTYDVETKEEVILQDGRTYRQDWLDGWKADKDWLGNDKVERDWLGNPVVERDWKGDQKVKRDWKGDPIVPPTEK
jgi:hypothetical protein